MAMLKLPCDIWAGKIVSMLDLKGISQLDVALLRRDVRDRWQEILSSYKLDLIHITTEDLASWLIEREIKFEKITVGTHLPCYCIEQLSLHCPELECFGTEGLHQLGEPTVQAISNWRHLTSISFCIGSCVLAVEFVTMIAQSCRQLRKLHLERLQENARLEPAFLTLAVNCPLLEDVSFNLQKSTDMALVHIARHCPGLKNLALFLSRDQHTNGLIAVAENCPNLLSLSLRLCSISDEAMAAVGRNCRKLERLFLINVHKVTDSGLVVVAKNCSQLRSLKCYDQFITNVSTEAFFENCPLLEEVKFDACRMLTDGVVASAAANLAHLQVFMMCVGGCGVTNAELVQLVDKCSEMRELTIFRYVNEAVTVETLIHIMEKCKKLKELFVHMGETKLDTLEQVIEFVRANSKPKI